MDYVIAAVAAFVISIGGSLAGGGGAMLMTPLLLLLGFPAQAVLATSKAAGLGINIGALGKFTKQKGLINWRWVAGLAVMAITASFIGTRIVFIFDEVVLEKLIGITTLAVIPILLLHRRVGSKRHAYSLPRKILGLVLYFIIMVIQAGIGGGIGILLVFILMGMMGLDALSANATKRAEGLVLVTTSFIIFSFSGFMDWWLALALGPSMLAGGYIGAHLAVKHGNELVLKAMIVAAFIMGVSVLL